jgi:hypothetical protein
MRAVPSLAKYHRRLPDMPVLAFKDAGHPTARAAHVLVPLPCSTLPMFPKHTQLQKRTLATHVDTAICSELKALAASAAPAAWSVPFCTAGVEGTQSGLTPSMTAAPSNPTEAASKKPVRDLSTRYHAAGLARASVSDACIEDSHGRRLCVSSSQQTKKAPARSTVQSEYSRWQTPCR